MLVKSVEIMPWGVIGCQLTGSVYAWLSGIVVMPPAVLLVERLPSCLHEVGATSPIAGYPAVLVGSEPLGVPPVWITLK